MDRVSEYSLMSFEREEGFTLMCSTIAESDLVIEVEEEGSDLLFFAVHDFEAEVVENHQVRRYSCYQTEVIRSSDIPYGCGQFFEFDVPVLEDTRAYSLANKFQDE